MANTVDPEQTSGDARMTVAEAVVGVHEANLFPDQDLPQPPDQFHPVNAATRQRALEGQNQVRHTAHLQL